MENHKPLEYSIEEIKTNQFAIFDNDSEKKGKTLSISTSFAYGVDAEEKKFANIIDITYNIEKSPIIKIQTQIIFKFTDRSFDSFIHDNKFLMQQDKVRHFTELLIGATRGILATELKDTVYKKYILPEINLEEVITTPLEIEM